MSEMLVSEVWLAQATGVRFVSTAQLARCGEPAARSLGCSDFTLGHLIECLEHWAAAAHVTEGAEIAQLLPPAAVGGDCKVGGARSDGAPSAMGWLSHLHRFLMRQARRQAFTATEVRQLRAPVGCMVMGCMVMGYTIMGYTAIGYMAIGYTAIGEHPIGPPTARAAHPSQPRVAACLCRLPASAFCGTTPPRGTSRSGLLCSASAARPAAGLVADTEWPRGGHRLVTRMVTRGTTVRCVT